MTPREETIILAVRERLDMVLKEIKNCPLNPIERPLTEALVLLITLTPKTMTLCNNGEDHKFHENGHCWACGVEREEAEKCVACGVVHVLDGEKCQSCDKLDTQSDLVREALRKLGQGEHYPLDIMLELASKCWDLGEESNRE